jgi:hypothetical protein
MSKMNNLLTYLEHDEGDQARTPVFGSLSPGSKAAVIILFGGWGLGSLVGGYQGAQSYAQMLKQMLILDPEIIWYGIIYCSLAIQGAVLLILLLDYISSPKIIKRHRAELVILLGLKVISDLTWIWTNFSMQTYPSDLSNWVWIRIILFLPTMAESLLSLYLIKRLLSAKAVLTKWAFLLASTVFIALSAKLFLFPVMNLIQFSNPITIPSAKDIILDLVYYGLLALAAIFSIMTFKDLRRGGEFELSLPKYLRVSIILYALVYGVYGVWSSYVSSSLAFSFNLSIVAEIALNAMFFVGLIVFSVFPPSFKVGGDR